MGDAAVLDFEGSKAKKFLGDIRDNPFLAVVVYENGTVCVFDKGIGTEEATRIREVIEETLSEGN